MRRFSDSTCEVGTALGSHESGYHSAPSQEPLQVETELDLLDSLILEDVKERLQDPIVSDSQLQCLGSLVSALENPSEFYQGINNTESVRLMQCSLAF